MNASFRMSRGHLLACVIAAVVIGFIAASLPSTAAAAEDCEAEAKNALETKTVVEDEEGHLPDEQVEACGTTVSLAELDDLLYLSDSEDIDLSEAIDRYHWQDDFAELVDEFRTEYPDEYSGARFEPEGDSWIAFKDRAPATADDEIADWPIDLVEDRGFSEAELNDTLTEVFTEISDREDVESSAGDYDQVTGEVTIEVVADDEAAAEDIDEETWTADNPEITVVTEIVDDPDWELESDIQGGGHLGDRSCTAGFSVFEPHSLGQTGVSTAHHCATERDTGDVNPLEYQYWTHFSTVMPIQFRWRAAGENGDIAWYGDSAREAASRFYSEWQVTRPVTDTATPVEGQTLFNYGRTTGRDDAQVEGLNQCLRPDEYPTYCGLTAMDAHVTDSGDSGGPWYHATLAYGIHSGSRGGDSSLFTPVVPNLSEGLGIRVLTQ